MPCKCLETNDISNCCPPFEKKSISCKRHLFNIRWYFSNDEKYMNMSEHDQVDMMIKLWGLKKALIYYKDMIKKPHFLKKINTKRVYETDAIFTHEINFCEKSIIEMVTYLKEEINNFNNIKTREELTSQLEKLYSTDERQKLLDFYKIVNKLFREDLLEKLKNIRAKKQKVLEEEAKDIQFNQAYE